MSTNDDAAAALPVTTTAAPTTVEPTKTPTSESEPQPTPIEQQKIDEEKPTSTPTIAAAADDSAYAAHVTYATDGTAIYTDPTTQHRYKWCATQNSWQPLEGDADASGSGGGDNAQTPPTGNPYENEHYKWCSETRQWLPKQTPTPAQTSEQEQQLQSDQEQSTETEHYRWDAARREWVAKVPAAADGGGAPVYDVDADGQRIYTDKDGTVYVWDAAKSAWFPKIDDDFMARYQMSYGFIDNTSAGEHERQLAEQAEAQRKAAELQRMTEEAKAAATAATTTTATDSATATKRKAVQEPPKWFDMDPEHNTKVYVSNLPLDITLDEFAELMGKCGMIMRDAQTQKYKVKLYTEADGQIKGDGLCDYIKVESVALALKILDEYNLRGNKIRVQRAQFQMRGEYNPALKPKRKKKDKEKLQKMKEKLFDWRPEKMRGERSKNEKTVILKNLFQPELFEQEVQLILDYQNDLREECTKCGTVRKVVIYDRHPEGVAQVNMASPEEADLVVQMMQGRFFGKRQLTAEHWDGKTKYKVAESVTETEQRLSNWDRFLDNEEEKKTDGHNAKVEPEAKAPAAAIAKDETTPPASPQAS